MIIEVTEDKVYVLIIVVLSVMQILQWRKIHALKYVLEEVFDQIRVLAMATGAKIEEVERKIDRNENRK